MRSRELDPYEVLGLEDGATWAEVRAAYRRLAKKHHPDKNPGDRTSEWIFKQVGEAYERLEIIHGTRSSLAEDHKRRGQQGRKQGREPQQSAQSDHRARERRDKERARAGHDQQKSQRPPPSAPHGGSGVAEGSNRRRRAWRSLVAVPAGLIVVALALVATEGIRDRMNDAEPAVVNDGVPSPAHPLTEQDWRACGIDPGGMNAEFRCRLRLRRMNDAEPAAVDEGVPFPAQEAPACDESMRYTFQCRSIFPLTEQDWRACGIDPGGMNAEFRCRVRLHGELVAKRREALPN